MKVPKPVQSRGYDSAVLPGLGHFDGTAGFCNSAQHRHGDLFPLPLPKSEGYEGAGSELRSRRSQRRVNFRHFSFCRAEATVRSLNQMAGFVDEKSWPQRPLNRAQAEGLDHILRCHMQRARPVEDMSDQEALRQLLARRAGYGDSPGALASLVLERLSLPRGQSEPVSLLDVLPEDEVRRVQNFALTRRKGCSA